MQDNAPHASQCEWIIQFNKKIRKLNFFILFYFLINKHQCILNKYINLVVVVSLSYTQYIGAELREDEWVLRF